ncbi:LacI family DNA-binding transcriptional regulator [Alloscardovia macacae]|uniref:LacI family transcription regulator n=1 Tax=Alloscardovia macacae TaxID=1160091 RepID=A0A261F664_9BIFI|nr:LacI family DNA-binding transcriptional regulator [Alloscardovia macacae]OZG54639.1 LacI family transcription regulator [Alloscardovia macacae]
MSESKVSMVDVAKAAGVSYQTVSRVINNSPLVRDSTRQKVQDVIAQLGYRPNLSAQSLKSQRTRMIGVIASQTQYSGPLLTIAAIESMARSRGLYVCVATVDEARLNPADFADVEENFIKLGVEAVVIVAPTEAMVTLALDNSGRVRVPHVIITAAEGLQDLESRRFDAARVKFVSTDQDEASEAVSGVLAASGVTHVYYLDGPQQWRDAFTRRAACERACVGAGLSVTVLEMNDWVSTNAYDRVGALLARGAFGDAGALGVLGEPGGAGEPGEPESVESESVESGRVAFWAANDLLAMGARRAVLEAGLRVPDDVCIVGYDDMPGTESLVPPLTTVNPNYERVGSTAMQLVLDMLEYSTDEDEDSVELVASEKLDCVYMVQPQVVLRASTR